MSIKKFNHVTGEWEKCSTMLAGSIKVVDPEENFESQNAEGCLRELKKDLKKAEQDIKYIYQNGTIGGGSGGGTSSPTVTIDGLSEIIVKSDEIIDIFYYFKSPNPGNGKAHLSWGSNVTVVDAPQRRNKWTVGPFSKGKHVLTITVEDKQGFWTDPVTVTVISGSLEITSDFNDKRDFTVDDDIKIPFNIDTLISDEVFVDLTLNGETQTVPGRIGANEWKIGKINYMGVNNASIKAKNSTYESNTLKFTIVIADSENLLLSSQFDQPTIQIGKRLMIDYRISMKGQYQFKTELYLDGSKVATVTDKPGVNFWDVGTNLELGTHNFRIVTRTMDGEREASLELTTEVTSQGFDPFRPVDVGLIAAFDANGKLNNSDNKNIWEDLSGNNVECNLHYFNFATNGWIDNSLKFNGKTYAEVDLSPFSNGIKNGFTFDVLYKINNVGDIDAKVLSCKNPITPFQGIAIDTSKSLFSTKNSEIVSAPFQEDVWTRKTFVVDRSTKTMKLYVNAVLSNVTYLNDAPSDSDDYIDEFTYDGKLVLGGEYDESGNIIHNSSCSLKSIRIYDRALTHDEVLQNHISDIKEEEEQLAIRELNFGENTIPIMKINGNLEDFTEDEERIVQIDYHDPRDSSKRIVKDGCKVSWQGTSSRDYPVKNYTIKLMEGGNPLLTYAPKDDWRPEDRWTLKANYMDSSHANNLGTNKFIHDFFKPNPYPQQIKDPTTRANVDGFPIKLIVNGEDMGIYTWNVDRYAPNNYGFVTYNSAGIPTRHPNAVSYEIGVNSTTGAGAFWDDSWESIRSEFKHRYNFRGEKEFVTEEIGPNQNVLAVGKHNELVDLVSWVCNSTDSEFYAELKEHFSVVHLIDYYLIAYTLGMVDNLGKNMVLTTFGRNEDGNTIWYPSFYDCDSILGLANNGKISFGPGLDMANGDYNTSNSALWTKLNKNFGQEIRDRYRELRMERNVDGMRLPAYFSTENLMNYYAGEITDTVGQKFYNNDADKKYLIPESKQWIFMCSGHRKEYTTRWLNERFIYLDSVFEHERFTNKKVVLRSNVTGPVSLRLKTYSPQWVLISFSDSSTDKVKKYVDKDMWYEFEAYLNNGRDNNISIYGADNIMYIDGIKDLNTSFINIGQAQKMVELDCSNSTYIQQISLGDNTYLQTVKCSNCKNLGAKDEDKILDLEKCINLRYLDCSRTKLGSIKFNKVGGVLDYLDCSETSITTFELVGQEYLEKLELASCPDLSELTVTNCNGLKTINMPDTKLALFAVTGCDKIEYIDISQTKFLERLDLRGCPNLRVLKMKGVSNSKITDLDLTSSLNLEELDISSTSYLRVITFGQYRDEGNQLQNFNKLKKLNCSNSVIESIRYGKTSPIPEDMNLAGLNLEDVNFQACTNVKRIKNINMIAKGSSSPFANCRNLISIEGNIKLVGSISRAFFECEKLVTLPNLDLSEVTSASESFALCRSFTMNHVKTIMSKFSSKLTSQWRLFYSIPSITGSIPANLFSTTTGLTTLSEIFYNCSGITGTLDVNLLKPMTNLTNCYYAFSKTGIDAGSEGLPTDLLRYNTKLTTTEGMFNGTKIRRVPNENFFKYNIALENCYSMFGSCKEMQGTIPERLFANNRNLRTVGSFFNGTGIVGEIPPNIFNNIPVNSNGTNQLRSAEYFIHNTQISGEIPPDLFKNCKLVDSLRGFFSSTQVTGEIPTNLLNNCNNLIRISALFENCKGLTGAIPPNLLRNKPKITLADRVFKGCVNLISEIPQGFLDDCIAITDVSEMFYNCSGLFGQIPKRVSTFEEIPNPENPEETITVERVSKYGIFDNSSELLTANGVFYNCYNLRSEIPETLLINATKITSVDYLFYKCVYLYGGIPKKLFNNCFNLQSANYTFSNCVSLQEYIIDEDNPYAVPEDLFANNFNLTTAIGTFRMDGQGNPHPSRLEGAIPPNLFRSNTKLTNIEGMFCAAPVSGDIDGNLFRYNTLLENASWLFWNSKLNSLGSNLFSTCGKIKNLSYTFAGNTTLRGNAPRLWESTATTFARCFQSCTGLDNYAQIPDNWK